MTTEDLEAMKDLDQTYNIQEFDKNEEEKRLEREAELILDPYTKKQATKMKHQEYRTIIVGKEDLLKNGQMVQISVSDPFNEKLFHPTDRVIVAKH